MALRWHLMQAAQIGPVFREGYIFLNIENDSQLFWREFP